MSEDVSVLDKRVESSLLTNAWLVAQRFKEDPTVRDRVYDAAEDALMDASTYNKLVATFEEATGLSYSRDLFNAVYDIDMGNMSDYFVRKMSSPIVLSQARQLASTWEMERVLYGTLDAVDYLAADFASGERSADDLACAVYDAFDRAETIQSPVETFLAAHMIYTRKKQ